MLLLLYLAIQDSPSPLPDADPWKNLNNLFGAYALIFTAIFVYTLLIGARQKRLDKRIERLKEETKER
jgi:CcmD family protein